MFLVSNRNSFNDIITIGCGKKLRSSAFLIFIFEKIAKRNFNICWNMGFVDILNDITHHSSQSPEDASCPMCPNLEQYFEDRHDAVVDSIANIIVRINETLICCQCLFICYKVCCSASWLFQMFPSSFSGLTKFLNKSFYIMIFFSFPWWSWLPQTFSTSAVTSTWPGRLLKYSVSHLESLF